MNSLLLVVDMQNDFIKDRSPYSCQMLDDYLIKRVKKLLDFFRERKIKVVFTQHSIKSNKSNAEFGEPQDVRACIIGTDGWKIINDLDADSSKEYFLRKDKYDAFYDTELESLLKMENIDTVIICGVLANNCIRATAEGAHYRNFKVIIVTDCCGATSYIRDISHEQMHEITLGDLKERMYNISLIGSSDLIYEMWIN